MVIPAHPLLLVPLIMKRIPSVAVRLLLFPLLALAIPACTGEKLATVSGKVTFKDKPLPGGTVLFVTEDKSKSESAQVDSEGNYSASNVPYGKLHVGVQPAAKSIAASVPKGVPNSKAPKDQKPPDSYTSTSGQYVDIPAEFRDPATSKLTVTVESGNVPFNIDILKGSK